MRSLVVVWLLVCSVCLGYSQETGSINGKVFDLESSDPLVGASVTIKNTPLGTSADASGAFVLADLKPGTHELRVSYVGYIPQSRQVYVRRGESTTVTFWLTASAIPAQPITVTATRGRERETPATFATLERQTIRERYTTQDIPVLLSELPSSTFYSEAGNGIGYTYLNIRGFDSRRIAVMVNGIPQNDPEDHNVYWLDFPDLAASLEDIQVQRGAGSAFYGPPAIGGSVNLVTANFGRERSLQFSGGLGSYNTRRYSASFSSGLIENQYALHGRLSKLLSNGYRDRSWTDFNSYFLGLIRYDENMTTQINFYGGPVSDHLAYYGIPKPDVKDRAKRKANPIAREEEIENFSQPHYEVFHEWRISPTATLNNSLFLVTGEGFFDYDGSWAPYSYYRITRQNGFAVAGDPDTLYLPGALIRANVSNMQYGWLPRLTVKHEKGEFITGAELRIHRSEHWGRLQWAQELPADVSPDFHYYQYRGAKDIVSFYAHELYFARPDLTLMFDLQYVYNRYRLYDEQFVHTDFSVPYHFVNPRVGINYNFDERWNGYLTAAYTSREPRLKNLYDAAESSGGEVPQFGTNSSGLHDFNSPLVRPESLVDIELGGGYTVGGLSLRMNLYWMEFSNEIVKSGQVDRFGQPITGNADRTRHSGVELTGRARLLNGLELTGNLTYSRNTITRNTAFVKRNNPATGRKEVMGVVLDGNPVAGFPNIIANARLTYRYEHCALSLSGRYVGKQYTDNFKNEVNTVDPYVVSDAWVSYTFVSVFNNIDIEAKLQVNNIFDRLYAAYGEGEEFFVGAERNAFFTLAINI